MLLKRLQSKLTRLQYSPLHPQWISNRCHLEKFKDLAFLEHSVILDIGSGNSPVDKYIESSNFLIRSDYPNTSVNYGNKPDLFLDAARIPLADQSVDCVLIFEVLEHVHSSEQVVEEIARVLKKDGLVYLSVPFMYPEHDLPNDFQRFTRLGIKNILEKKGLNVENDKPIGNGGDAIFLMINMYLLMILASVNKKSVFLLLLIIPFVYAACLLVNTCSVVFGLFPKIPEFYIGRSVRARRG